MTPVTWASYSFQYILCIFKRPHFLQKKMCIQARHGCLCLQFQQWRPKTKRSRELAGQSSQVSFQFPEIFYVKGKWWEVIEQDIMHPSRLCIHAHKTCAHTPKWTPKLACILRAHSSYTLCLVISATKGKIVCILPLFLLQLPHNVFVRLTMKKSLRRQKTVF